MASDVDGLVWPDGCPKKSACARHSACMYGCAAHKDRPPGDVASEINAETERREGIKIDPADRLSHMAREIAADSFLVDAIARWTKQVIAEVVAYEKEKHAEAASALISERDARVKAEKERDEAREAVADLTDDNAYIRGLVKARAEVNTRLEARATAAEANLLSAQETIANECERVEALLDRATAAEAKLTEVEKERSLERLTNRQAQELWAIDQEDLRKAEASLATATEALRRADSLIANDNGDVTWSPLTIREVIRATIAQISAGTAEHPDSVAIPRELLQRLIDSGVLIGSRNEAVERAPLDEIRAILGGTNGK